MSQSREQLDIAAASVFTLARSDKHTAPTTVSACSAADNCDASRDAVASSCAQIATEPLRRATAEYFNSTTVA